MDFNATVDLIVKVLYDAREIIDDLKNYPGVPELQVELAKSKCKSAADIIMLLKTLKNRDSSENKIPVISENMRDEATPKKIREIPDQKENELKTELRSPVSLSEKKAPGQTSRKKTGSPIVADTFSDLPGSLNEQIGYLRDEDDFSEIIKSKPLINLSDAIGVNDKFLFIRELFNGNPESYDKAISKLDQAASLEDARSVIMNYTDNENESDAARQLFDLVKRKFPVNE